MAACWDLLLAPDRGCRRETAEEPERRGGGGGEDGGGREEEIETLRSTALGEGRRGGREEEIESI